MKLFGIEVGWAQKSAGMDISTILQRLDAIYELASGVVVTPERAMRSPTVQARVQAISRRIATLPVNVLRKTTSGDGRTKKELLPDHAVAKLLQKPSDNLTANAFWLDATSWLVRWGNFYAFKARGNTGPIRRLMPLPPSVVDMRQETDLSITYRATFANGTQQVYTPDQVMHARGPARDGIKGDSPVMDVAEAIALEIAAEKFGASYFGNGAMPGLVFNHAPGSQGFKTDEEAKRFTDGIQQVYAKRGRFKALV